MPPGRFPRLFRRVPGSPRPVPSRSGPPYPVDLADPALMALRRDIAQRFARVCEGMDPTTFAQLVDAMAVFRRRWGPGIASRHAASVPRAAS